METVTITEFKTNLSAIAEKTQKGEEFIVTHGRKRKKIFRVLPFLEAKVKRRKLGGLKAKGKVKIHADWEMSETDLMDI